MDVAVFCYIIEKDGQSRRHKLQLIRKTRCTKPSSLACADRPLPFDSNDVVNSRLHGLIYNIF